MKKIVLSSPSEVARTCADIFAEQITAKPDSVLGFATGSTPIPFYRELVERHNQKKISFAKITAFNLDEYVGIDLDNPLSFHSYMKRNLYSHVDIDPKNIFFPDEKNNYEQLIQSKGGIDLQLLGIGRNGHIGFNEPGSVITSRTRLVELTQATVDDNKGPSKAITMGIASILETKKIILVATSKLKSQIVKESMTGPIIETCPASFLQKHSDVTVLLDRDSNF